MGGHQSSSRPDANASAAKTCYYELLGVDSHATDHDIKKAYRTRALELHPDRNLNDVETATARFAEVQAAYDVLSDPQERAWYDSHRDAILSGQTNPGDSAEPTAFHNVRLTTAQEVLGLMRKFDATVPFDDGPTGFFAIARETFEHLALEEEAAADFDKTDCPEYPTFGSSDDDYDDVVKPFYAAWAAFSTKKSFSWKDKHRLSDALDRRVRRLMEKENKKSRDDAIREFNDVVRFLVGFVRKRDPRYRPNTQTDEQRQKTLRDAAAAQAARSRAVNQQKMASCDVPGWAESREDGAGEHLFPLSEEESDVSEVLVLECGVCNKTFKSDKQLEAHERSKKHIKAFQHLRRQMEQEGADLNLDVAASPTPGSGPGGTPASPRPASAVQGAEDGTVDGRSPDNAVGGQESKSPQGSAPASDSDDYAPRSVVEERLAPTPGADEQAAEWAPKDVGHEKKTVADDMQPRPPKVGKAKAKRERKAAGLGSAEGNTKPQCSVCAECFTSRTRLFRHIREAGHAAATPRTVAVDGKASRKKQ